MKKFIVRCICVAISLVSILSFVGCTNTDPYADKIKLKVSFFKAGFGDEWLKAIAAEYEKINPDVKVIVEGKSNIADLIKSRFESGQVDKLSDIVSITDSTAYAEFIRNNWLDDLTGMYSQIVENDKTLLDVIDPNFLGFVTQNDKKYGIPWEGAVTGFAYNSKLFAANGWEEPTTMKEFFELCDKIRAEDIAPLVYCGGVAEGYFQSLMLSWMSQYEGKSSSEEFFNLGSPDVYKKDGRLKAYEQAARIVAGKTTDGKSIALTGSKSNDHLAAQREFILGNAAMLPTGSWLETEMSEFLSGFPNFEMKMFPVPSITDDQKDKNGDPIRIVSSGNCDMLAIPRQAAQKELAKDFLMFMSRQDMLNLYTEKTNGNPRPFIYEKTDWSNLSAFGQSLMNIWNKADNIFPHSDSPKFSSGEIGFWLGEAGMPISYLQTATSLTDANSKAKYLVQRDYEVAVGKFNL